MSFPSITIASANGTHQRFRIPGFRESGFDLANIAQSPAVSTPRDPSFPRSSSLLDMRLDHRAARPTLSPHELRLNTSNAEDSMYIFQGSRSPMSTTAIHMSPQLPHGPNEPTSASSTSSSQSMKSIKARQTRKQPSSRPAAKRMRDTRDREGLAIQHMESDLEAEGRLADLKPLNANNKEEAGRRYPKADVLERYCLLSNSRKHKLKSDCSKTQHDIRKCHAYERWCERWVSTLNKDAREQLEAMITEIAFAARQPAHDESFDSTGSFSTRSSVSDYDYRSPSSTEWLTEDHDFAGANLPHRPSDAYRNSHL